MSAPGRTQCGKYVKFAVRQPLMRQGNRTSLQCLRNEVRRRQAEINTSRCDLSDRVEEIGARLVFVTKPHTRIDAAAQHAFSGTKRIFSGSACGLNRQHVLASTWSWRDDEHGAVLLTQIKCLIIR